MTQTIDASASTKRQRIVEWSDTRASAKAAVTLSGMEMFTKLMAGELPPPPIMALMGITLESFEPGRVIMRMEPGEHLYNPIGSVHGGAVATLLDSVLGCAIHTTLPAGRAYTSLEIKVNFIRAVLANSGSMFAEGKVVHTGRKSAVAEATLKDANGKIYATASTTCLIFEPGA